MVDDKNKEIATKKVMDHLKVAVNQCLVKTQSEPTDTEASDQQEDVENRGDNVPPTRLLRSNTINIGGKKLMRKCVVKKHFQNVIKNALKQEEKVQKQIEKINKGVANALKKNLQARKKGIKKAQAQKAKTSLKRSRKSTKKAQKKNSTKM